MQPISTAEYQARRAQLAQSLPSNSIALIPAAREQTRNSDNHYRFRQDSDFFYLTGFNEPDAVLLISSGKSPDTFLFNRPNDPLKEQWTGHRLGQDLAPEALGVDKAYPIDTLERVFTKYYTPGATVYSPLNRYPHWDHWLKATTQGLPAPPQCANLSPFIHHMRLTKSEAEIQCLRVATQTTVAAHTQAMKRVKSARYEYQLEAALWETFLDNGCRDTAYDSIVAGGSHACTLHYSQNNAPLHPDEMVLIDAGAEFYNYAADVTRTFPINGQYTDDQKRLYDVVLRAQSAGIDTVKPGTPWPAIQTAIVHVLVEGLVDLGILTGNIETLIENKAYQPFYMHQSGHWLGLDVHDCLEDSTPRTKACLEPGMALTVEPGLYISPTTKHIDERWKGMGIRIEDDILVTNDGHENLTAALPVETDNIEALINGEA